MNAPNTYGVLTPCGGGETIPLFKRKMTIGRRTNCDVVLNFPNISSTHCELELLNGYWFVKDLGSANGIKVNDTRCESRFLSPGDFLTIAKHRYQIDYSAVGDAPLQEVEAPFSRSLMELAGLERGRSGNQSPLKKPVPPKREEKKTQSRPEDDAAMRWLEDESK